MKYITKKSGIYWPSKEMKKIAWVSNSKIYKQADKAPIKFWEKLAKQGISWEKPWKKTYIEKIPYFWWFKGGKLNFCFNCLDRHIEKKDALNLSRPQSSLEIEKHLIRNSDNGKNIKDQFTNKKNRLFRIIKSPTILSASARDKFIEGKLKKTALIWVPEPLNEKTIKLTYQKLYEKVNRFANVLKKLNVKKGDVVAIYLPLIPEIAIAMLACTRIGAIHSVVFSAFSAEALKARILDGNSKILITADGYYRRGKKLDLLSDAKKAIRNTKIKKIIVVNRLYKNKKYKGKFLSFEEELKKVPDYCKPETMNSENILFVLYTSGTTGKPKGIVHDIGGYAVQAYWTTKWDFNLHDDDILWCTADVGWITGHTYAIYGPLLNGSTTLLYEGTPDFPNPGRWWKIIDENKVTAFYTAPTAIRMLMKSENKYLKRYNLNTLRILGTVGEPIDEEAWFWYFKKIGNSRCPVIDTWWQTETGGTLINVLPGIGPFIPTIAGKSFPGTRHEVVDEKGKKSEKGFLVQLSPFAPGMLHGIFNNHKKYVETYWKRFKNKYDTSDGALIKKGLIRLTGRTDDVMKVAGHRLATAELENALDESEFVNESAVVPIPDKIKGQVPVAFIVLEKGKSSPALEAELKKHVDKVIGPTARPSRIFFVNDLPKTRSGKIMRRILKDILNNEKLQGLMTLMNPRCVEEIKEVVKQNHQCTST